MMKNGKLPCSLLKKLLENTAKSPEVIQGPQIGIDAAKIKTGGKNFVIGADPITFLCENIGKYCVYINSNDIIVSGAVPKFFISTILLPTSTEERTAEYIFREIKEACKECSISLIGGHTEITDAVTRPVISGTMIGEEIYNFQPKKAPIGSDIILINRPAIEGTAIIAYNGYEYLKKMCVSEETLNYCLNLTKTNGISLLSAGIELFKFKNVYYMHDPTEGGLASALSELSLAIGKRVSVSKPEFMDETEILCKVFGLDPWGLIASGSLLAVAENGDYIAEKMTDKGYYAKVIGKVTEGRPNVICDGKPIKTFDRDEIARFFEILQETDI